MSAGLLDGSCGGIMFACCQRRDAKAISSAADYNTIPTGDTTRAQLQPQLGQDAYTDPANEDDSKFITLGPCPSFRMRKLTNARTPGTAHDFALKN